MTNCDFTVSRLCLLPSVPRLLGLVPVPQSLMGTGLEGLPRTSVSKPYVVLCLPEKGLPLPDLKRMLITTPGHSVALGSPCLPASHYPLAQLPP